MSGKILVVEYNPSTRKHICHSLRKNGYEIEEAGDGAEAIELLNAWHFDLVVVDFSVPRLSGFSLVEMIHSERPNTPVILMTGYLFMDAAKERLKGTAEILCKPVELDVLQSMVRRLLPE
jgi:CheY-like chemotaxis protein